MFAVLGAVYLWSRASCGLQVQVGKGDVLSVRSKYLFAGLVIWMSGHGEFRVSCAHLRVYRELGYMRIDCSSDSACCLSS